METPRAPSHGKQAIVALLLSIATTVALAVIPNEQTAAWLVAPFRWLSIYVHEFGHGIAALIAGGHFEKFEMWTYSGVATTDGYSGGLAQAFVSAGGLCGPAVVGAIFLALGKSARVARWTLGAFGLAMVASLVLWVRTPFGWGFGAAVALLALMIALRGSAWLAQTLLVFLGMQLALSEYTNRAYLFVQEATLQNGQTMASDTQHMADSIGMTYWFWGAICAAFSAAVLIVGLWIYIRPSRSRRPLNAGLASGSGLPGGPVIRPAIPPALR